MSPPKIRLGTRGSQLALCQSNHIADQLREFNTSVEVIILKTDGDVKQGPLSSFGGEGVFTKRLQDALLANEIDLAVHSLKDLPTESFSGLIVAAVPKREDSRDALIVTDKLSNSVSSIDDLPHAAKIGTGSVRRKAQLLNLRPDLVIKDIRGNLDTRLAKVASGEFDAIILACAGLNRLGWNDKISAVFPVEQLAPAPGQGAIGLEVRSDDIRTITAVANLNDGPTMGAVTAERTMLNKLRAGCLAPVGAYTHFLADELHLTGVILSTDGASKIESSVSGQELEAVELGERAASELIEQGGDKFLN